MIRSMTFEIRPELMAHSGSFGMHRTETLDLVFTIQDGENQRQRRKKLSFMELETVSLVEVMVEDMLRNVVDALKEMRADGIPKR